MEKVRLINVFAGVCYQQGDYQSAFDLLSAALELDGQDAATLKILPIPACLLVSRSRLCPLLLSYQR